MTNRLVKKIGVGSINVVRDLAYILVAGVTKEPGASFVKSLLASSIRLAFGVINGPKAERVVSCRPGLGNLPHPRTSGGGDG
jgi:hypothetical protein